MRMEYWRSDSDGKSDVVGEKPVPCLPTTTDPTLIALGCRNFIFTNTERTLINLLKPTGYVMHQQFTTFNNCTFCPHCIYLFCIYLRTNSDLCHLQHKLIGFYNRDEKCLLRGTNWVYIKQSALRI